MRPAIVLTILVAALVALALARDKKVNSFDGRYEQVEDRIRALSNDIDRELEAADGANTQASDR